MDNSTVRDYLKIIFRRKVIIIASIVIVIAVTFFKVQFITPYYTATVKLLVKGQMLSEVDYYKQIGPFNVPSNHIMLITSKPVLENVVMALKLYERPLDFDEKRLASKIRRYYIDRSIESLTSQLKQMTYEERRAFLIDNAIGRLYPNIEAVRESRSDILIMNVRDYNAEMAATIANSISRSYLIFDIEQQIAELELEYGDKNPTIIQLNSYIQDLYETLDGKPIPGTVALGAASIKVVSQALNRGTLVKPINKKMVLALAILGSIVFGITLAFAIELLDQTFKSPREIEHQLNLPVLGSIPKNVTKKTLFNRKKSELSTDFNNSYQNLADQIYMVMKDQSIKTILLVDAENSKDASSIIANLGKLLADKANNRVLIIDANLRSPFISQTFNLNAKIGLIDVLEGKIKFADAVNNVGNNLYILPANETIYNPITLLDSNLFTELMKEVKELYDIVFISCADLKNHKDAAAISTIVDGVVLVLSEGKVRRLVAKQLITSLEQKEVNIVGTILNNRTHALPNIVYRLT